MISSSQVENEEKKKTSNVYRIRPGTLHSTKKAASSALNQGTRPSDEIIHFPTLLSFRR